VAITPGAELRNGTSATLFVVEAGKVSSRIVLISSLEGDQVEVVSGLATTDRVILMPPAELKEGDIVEIPPA
jgi:multidrug efflux pump subunit AcrA (membrane-fusion protein)